ncbi:MAG: hypothetical protein DRJ40_00535 [Thermoprotei archaeon]|nr:MAG: hypothetical protein DRJ40_00535 [Thermoprotei archaeon]
MERLCSVSPSHQFTPGIGSRVEISSRPLSASTVVAMAIPQLLHVVLLRNRLQEVESDLEVMIRYLTDDEPPTAFRELYSKLCELGLDDADARFVYATPVSAYSG